MTPEEFITEWKGPAEYICAHTSGSTGSPKTIRLSKRLVRESALRSIRHFGLGPDTSLHLCLSADYIAGKMVIVRALESGAPLSWEPPSQTPLAKMPATGRIHLLSVVGAQIFGLPKTEDTRLITHLLVGGAPMTEAQAEDALTRAEHVWESYGMTETASHIALREIRTPADVHQSPFTVLDGIEVGCDERSCLRIDLPGHPSLQTNDICRILAPGKFFILGREDNAIITGGKKVFPEEIERKISYLLPSGSQYFITSEPDVKWGQRLVLVMEEASCPEIQAQTLLSTIRSGLQPHEMPRSLKWVKEIPRTSSGKIIRRL